MKLDVALDELFTQTPATVWHALTDARVLARWLMDNDFAPVVGHRFTLRDAPHGGWRGWVECTVLELDPPHRMVWSWHAGREGEVETRVIFELRPEGGGTRLCLRHEGEALPIQRDGLTSGWRVRMPRLRHVLEEATV